MILAVYYYYYYLLLLLLLFYSALDLGLPLWLGGAPSSSSPLSLPFSLRGSNACIRNVLLDNVLLDLEGFVDEENSQNGCPQVERERERSIIIIIIFID